MKRMIALLSVLALTACGTAQDVDKGLGDRDAAEPAAGGIGARCSSDSACPQGQGCLRAAGVCVAMATGTWTYSVAIDPAPGGDALADQYASVPLGSTTSLDLNLSLPVHVTGSVVHGAEGAPTTQVGQTPSAADGDIPITGRLVATATGRIPGTQFRSEARVGAAALGKAFDLAVLPGVAYQVAFLPDAPAAGNDPLPPYYFPLQADESGRRDVVLPPRASYLKVTGIVLTGIEKKVPLAGAQVHSRVGDQAIGTSAVSDADGRFTVVVPPATGTVTLEVRPGPSLLPFPVRKVTFAATGELAASLDSNPTLAIEVDSLTPRRQVSVQVLGTRDGENAPVVGATVRLSGTVGDGDLSFSAATDAAGVVTIRVPEAAYDLVVLPTADSPWAATRSTVDLLANSGDAFLLRLERRIAIGGTVVRQADGMPIPGAVVSVLTDRLGPAGASQVVGQETAFDTVTDAAGAFTLTVDPGVYAINVIPPSSSGLGRFSQPTLDLSTPRTLIVPLPEGTLMRGRVSSVRPDGAGGFAGVPVQGGKVRFYFDARNSQAGNAWSLQGTSFSARLQLAAEASTGADGSFETVIPVLVDPAPEGNEPGGGKYNPADGGFGLPPVEIL